jgi:hypothetical protein
MTRRIPTKKQPITIPPMICRNREDVTLALKQARECRGMSQSDLDEKAGFHLGYTGKLEQSFPRRWPSGRCPLHPMFDLWLQALGVAVIIVPDTHSVDRLRIGDAVPPMRSAPTMTFKRAQKVRLLAAEGWSVKLIAASFHCTHRTVKDILEGTIFPVPPSANDDRMSA